MRLLSVVFMLFVCLQSAAAVDLTIVTVGKPANSAKIIKRGMQGNKDSFTKISKRSVKLDNRALSAWCKRIPARGFVHYLVPAKELKSFRRKTCSVSTATRQVIPSGKILSRVINKQVRRYTGTAVMPMKKIIAFDVLPDTAYLRDHVTAMENVNVDGVIFDLTFESRNNESFRYLGMNPTPMSRAEFVPAAADLITTPFLRYQHNFVLMNARPGADMNWFDDGWLDTVVQKMHHLGWFLKQTGQRGVMIDPEEYGGPVWHVASLTTANSHTYLEHCMRAQEWGRQMIGALLEEYPNIKIIIPHPNIGFMGDPALELWSWFLNGVAMTSLGRGNLIVTTENTYTARVASDFDYYGPPMRAVVNHPLIMPNYANQAIYGFAVSPTGGEEVWSSSNYAINYHQPQGFRDVLIEMIKYSDEYSWIYFRRVSAWGMSGLDELPADYKQALKDARTAMGLKTW